MIQFSKKDNEKVLNVIKEGKIDSADISFPNLIDTIVLKMKNLGLLTKLMITFEDKRMSNSKYTVRYCSIISKNSKNGV